MNQKEHQQFRDQWEDRMKNWMRIGLQPDKWIQLVPGGKKIHPWFLDEKTVDRKFMANDALWWFEVAEDWTESLVRKWADEVADAYEAANNER